MNPAEFLLDLMNVDFTTNSNIDDQHLVALEQGWRQSDLAASTNSAIKISDKNSSAKASDSVRDTRPNFFPILLTLVHRSFIKSYRDVVAYGIRLAMYTGLAIMMATVWLRLKPEQSDIQPFINAIVSTLPRTINQLYIYS